MSHLKAHIGTEALMLCMRHLRMPPKLPSHQEVLLGLSQGVQRAAYIRCAMVTTRGRGSAMQVAVLLADVVVEDPLRASLRSATQRAAIGPATPQHSGPPSQFLKVQTST